MDVRDLEVKSFGSMEVVEFGLFIMDGLHLLLVRFSDDESERKGYPHGKRALRIDPVSWTDKGILVAHGPTAVETNFTKRSVDDLFI